VTAGLRAGRRFGTTGRLADADGFRNAGRGRRIRRRRSRTGSGPSRPPCAGPASPFACLPAAALQVRAAVPDPAPGTEPPAARARGPTRRER